MTSGLHKWKFLDEIRSCWVLKMDNSPYRWTFFFDSLFSMGVPFVFLQDEKWYSVMSEECNILATVQPFIYAGV
jgi:hypothetical protein